MFEWDDAKAALNADKHGVSFERASAIFLRPTLTATDDRIDYGEVRQVSIGSVDGTAIVTVVHTERRGHIRIISARPASSNERRMYAKAIRCADD